MGLAHADWLLLPPLPCAAALPPSLGTRLPLTVPNPGHGSGQRGLKGP